MCPGNCKVPHNAVYIILVNWRNSSDTVECLESVLSVASPLIRGVIVCDNDSGDDSMQKLRAWGARAPARFREYDFANRACTEVPGERCADGSEADGIEIVLIQTGANLGFAGGNNVGIRFLQECRSYDHIFLLNNDALLRPGAVESMVERLNAAGSGMCGATVIYYHDPGRVQALGGARFSPVFGRAASIGCGNATDAERELDVVEKQLGYVLGAALMISRDCLEAIGPMEEGYFLYYEEVDWAVRARRAGYRLTFAPEAEVLHKEGGTIGSSTKRNKRSLLSEYYLLRSRLAFTCKHYPFFIPSVLAFSVCQVVRHLVRFDLRRFVNGCRALSGLPFRGGKG